jgi:hypothetical protein
MTAKEILLKIKAAFDLPMPPAPPAAPAVPAAPVMKTYKLQDGVTELSITQAGELPAAGDTVMINGVPAPANTYTLEDGSTITVDATGMITVYTAMAAPPVVPPAPAIIAPAVPITQAQMEIMFAKFATGSTEDRIGNLETMCKALMECNYGYQIREASEDAAVQAYKDSVALQVSSLMASSQTALDEQKAINTKQQETITGLFELCTQLVEMPTADPVTLTESQKAKFDKTSAREERLQKMAEALKKQKSLA